MTDAPDKAAAAHDDASSAETSVADTVRAHTASGARVVTTDTPKAADIVTADTAKGPSTVTKSPVQAAGTVKAKTVKPGDEVTAARKGGAGGAGEKAPQRSMDQIEAELAVTRDRLAGRIDELTDYVKPANIVERQKTKLRSVFVDEYGGIKPDRVLVAAGAVAAVVGLSVLLRRRRRG